MIVAARNHPFTATLSNGTPNLAGTVSVLVEDVDGNIVIAASTANILELEDEDGDPTGVYVAARVANISVDRCVVIWSDDGSFDAETTSAEDLIIVEGVATPVLPPMPSPPGPGPVEGPCESWIDGATVADCCGVDYASDSSSRLDESAVAASMLLFSLSGRKFAGVCSQTVRPCLGGCGWQGLVGYPSQAWRWGIGPDGWGWWGGNGGGSLCGCRPLSAVKLAGYPVVAVDEVLIGGEALPELDADDNPNWRLDDWMFLTRMDTPGEPAQPRFWPGCQNLALDDSEPGTFAVSYRYGVAPPLPGVMAAQQLGCEIYKACVNDPACKLPNGTTKITRQGVSIERLLTTWSLQFGPGSWTTGLSLVDVFLNAYARYGATRRSAFWSPDLQPYARQVGS